MSLINRMLQELDKRHAAPVPPAAARAGSQDFAKQLRPIASAHIGSVWFWRVMAGVMVVVVGWVFWVMWQIMPRSLVTDRAYQSVDRARLSAPPAAATAPTTPASGVQPAAPAAPQSGQSGAAPSQAGTTEAAQAGTAAQAAPAPATTERLRLATELNTAIASRPGKPSQPAPARASDKETLAALKPKAGAAIAPDRPRPAAPKPEVRADKAAERPELPAPKLRSASPPLRSTAAAPDSVRIDKRVDATARERAETEYRRAMALVNQGRMAEGMDGLRAALAADPAYEAARQALVSLLLETKRIAEAATAVQEGLAINPANAEFGVLLARINVERGDPGGALALLKKYEKAERNNAQYHAFVAALYQRLGRDAEAIEQYQIAVRLNPGVGAWWVGLGISQEGVARQKDATESFRRAKATRSLNDELVAYVDRRLKQLE